MEHNSFYNCYNALCCYVCSNSCNGQIGTSMVWVIIINSCHYTGLTQEGRRDMYSGSYAPYSDI